MSFGLGPAEFTPAIGYDAGDLIFDIRTRHGRISLKRMRLAGRHNIANAMAAAAAALVSGVEPRAIEAALAEFAGLPHRMEFVAERGGVTYIDDSKGTNVASVVEALAAVRAPIILIAGGMDKGGDYGPLRGPLGEKVRRLILIGAARDTMRAALEGQPKSNSCRPWARRCAAPPRPRAAATPCCSRRPARVSISSKTMRSAGEYFRSWFGRFESVARSQLDPWLYLPAAALAVLGLLMVLNTTYFLGLEKTGDAFHFFKLQLCHIGVGLAVLALLSQLSLRGLRRLAAPLMVVAVVMLVALWIPGLGVMQAGRAAGFGSGRCCGALGAGQVRDGLFSGRLSEPPPGADEHICERAAARVHRGGTARAAHPEAAGLRQHGDGRDAVVCDAVRGGRAT